MRPCRFVLPEQNIGVVDELDPVCHKALTHIFGKLGVARKRADRPIEIRIVQEPGQMKAMAPSGSAPPDWSSAISYPDLDLILLPLTDGNGQIIVDLATMLEHELSHLALRQALKGAPVPRWFSEGIAVQQSEGSSLSRYWILWRATRGGRLIPLTHIERYPDRPGRINLAYAEAADFVGFLLRRSGWLGIRSAIRHTAKNASFDQACEHAYGRSLASLEKEWRAGLSGRWQWVPLLTGSGLVWGLIVVLFISAYLAAKRRTKRRIVEMEAEESIIDQTIGHFEKKTSFTPTAPLIPGKKTKIRIDDDIHTLH
jgi:hypothetical protein